MMVRLKDPKWKDTGKSTNKIKNMKGSLKRGRKMERF